MFSTSDHSLCPLACTPLVETAAQGVWASKEEKKRKKKKSLFAAVCTARKDDTDLSAT